MLLTVKFDFFCKLAKNKKINILRIVGFSCFFILLVVELLCYIFGGVHMSVLEIIAGVLLILTCIVLASLILLQEPKGQGLSSVISGTEMMSNETRGRTKEVRQVKMTRNFGIALFVLTVIVNVVSVIAK